MKLHGDSVKRDSNSYTSKYRQSSQKDVSVEGYLECPQGTLLEASSRNCG